MITHLMLAALVVSPAQAADPATRTCPSGGSSTLESVTEAHRAYGARSVSVVEAALARNVPALTRAVAATARFTVWNGDVGLDARAPGPGGAIEFFGMLSPAEYQFSTVFAGPISQDPCQGITVELLLRAPDRAASLQFKYERGMLMEVTGSEVSVTQGQLRRPGAD
jgi:hypothetical protein